MHASQGSRTGPKREFDDIELAIQEIRNESEISVFVPFVESAALDELPEWLSHECREIRELASKRLRECLASMPIEELPKYLTDTDPVIQKVAGDLLTRDSK